MNNKYIYIYICDERNFLKPLPSFDKMVAQSSLKF